MSVSGEQGSKHDSSLADRKFEIEQVCEKIVSFLQPCICSPRHPLLVTAQNVKISALDLMERFQSSTLRHNTQDASQGINMPFSTPKIWAGLTPVCKLLLEYSTIQTIIGVCFHKQFYRSF